jgi:hypothetical protein
MDPLKQFASLRRQLQEEKVRLETRLAELNQVLQSEPKDSRPTSSAAATARPVAARASQAANQLSLREAVTKALAGGPLSRKELVKAVENVGYVFRTKDPLNSMGVILYAKNAPFQKKDGRFFLPSGKQGNGGAAGIEGPRPPKKRTLSPEGRARIAAAQHARWSRQKRAS